MSRSPIEDEASSAADDYRKSWTDMVGLLREGRSFSGRERNCCFLNLQGRHFVDASAVTGFDFPDDARAIATVDWDRDGDLDAWVINRNAPRIRLLRNQQQSGNHFIALRLSGTTCNRDAIGARVTIQLAGSPRRLVKTLHAGDGFLTQSDKWIQFGLGDSGQVEQLTVSWPGRESQQFGPLEADRFYALRQGSAAQSVLPPRPTVPLVVSQQPDPPPVTGKVALTPDTWLPEWTYRSWQGERKRVPRSGAQPLLITIWAHWCQPCLKELDELTRREAELREAGLDVLALTTDGIRDRESAERAAAEKFLERINFPFASGTCAYETLEKLNLFQRPFVNPKQLDAIPTGLLVTPEGAVAAIYKGSVSLDTVLADVARISRPPPANDLSVPFPGRWHQRPITPLCDHWSGLSVLFLRHGYTADAARYAETALQREPEFSVARLNLRDAHRLEKELEAEAQKYRQIIRRQPTRAEPYYNLGFVLRRQHDVEAAIENYRQALHRDPNLVAAHFNLASLLREEGRVAEAREHFESVLRLDPGNQLARQALAEQQTD